MTDREILKQDLKQTVVGIMIVTPPPTPQPTSTTAGKSHRARNIGIPVVAIIILTAIGLALLSGSTGGTGTSSANSQASSSLASQTATLAKTTSITPSAVMVQAGGYLSYQFTVPNGTTNARVVGSFTVQGGNGNILVIIVDSANFAKFQNSQPSTRIYDSGRVLTSSFSISLSPGTYYLVYANKFDATNAKTVNNQVDLVYSS